MIKPSEIDLTIPRINPQNTASIEQAFDEAIRLAHRNGRWPASVDSSRDGASQAEIEHVADQYRAEGWKVVTGQRGERALIDHPNRVRS